LEKAAAARRAVTFGAVVPRYLAAREGELRPRAYGEYRRYLNDHWKPLHDMAVNAVTRQDVVGVIDDIERERGKVAADRARTALSTFFAWAIDRSYCDNTPILHIKARDQGGGRSRVLSEAELVEVWKSCGDHEHSRIVRLLILTGQRKSEIGDVTWPEIDFHRRQIELPPERTKNKRAHIVPLSEAALAILKGVLAIEGRERVFGRGVGGFSHWSGAKADLDARIAEARLRRGEEKPMLGWVLHDLRRSFVTHVNERKFAPPHVIEAIVNHVSGHLAGVAGIYNKAQYLAERRQALDLWGAHIATLVEGRAGKVVPLRKTA
jgi:integrase